MIDTGGTPDDDEVRTGRSDVHAEVPRSVVVLREHAAPEAEPDHSVAASVAAAGGADG